MSFTKLLEADIGMALLPALNLKVLLLNFMTVNKKCRDLARWKLIKSGDTTLSHASAAEFQAYLAQGRISTVCVNVAGLPRRVTELIMNGNSLGPLYEPSLQSYGYLFHINEAMHRFWNQLPHSPKIGMSQAMLNYIEKKGPGTQATSIAAYHRDVKYWGTSRVFGEFFVLFNRPDGTIFVSKDYSKVYLVLCLTAADSEEGPGMVTGEMSEELATTIVHGEVQTRLAYGTLLNWDGVIVQDGIMQERKLGNRCAEWIEWILALRAYQHAVDTNTLITSLYKIPPPDAAAVPMPTMPAGGVEQFRAEHEVLVRRICDQPLDESKFFAKWTVRALATSPLSLVMEFTDGAFFCLPSLQTCLIVCRRSLARQGLSR